MREKQTILDDLSFDVFIHTLQFQGNKTLSDAEIKIKTGGGYFSEQYGRGRYKKANPNHCGIVIGSLEDTEDVICAMLRDLEIEPGEFLLERFDLAVNTPIAFDDPILYKLNLYLAALYSAYIGADNSFRICGANLVKRSIEVRKKRRSPLLSIYNKNVESNGRNPANTRIEWRFVNQTGRRTMREAIEDFCAVLDKLPAYINLVNEQQTANLLREFERVKHLDNPDGRIQDLPTFVKCHAPDVFNREILSSLHSHYNEGKTRNWLQRYRGQGQGSLYLVGRGEIKAYIRTVKQAIIGHLKSNANTVTFTQKDITQNLSPIAVHSGFGTVFENLRAGNL